MFGRLYFCNPYRSAGKDVKELYFKYQLTDTAVDRIVRTLKRTPRGGELTWQVDVPPAVIVEVDPHDLEELLGNILDNAVKWARSTISVRVCRDAAGAGCPMTLQPHWPT